jgi:choline dehydrogenase
LLGNDKFGFYKCLIERNDLMPAKVDSRRNFDYIVIGAGTAGGVIAKELTDNKYTSVLVLEAGTNMREELSSPSRSVSATLASDNRHSFNILSKTEQVIRRQLRMSGGRAIGGSSEHNAMYAVRCSSNLYDEWAKLVGPQWSYNNIRPLFKKNETYTGNTQEPNERGKDGPIFIRQQMIPKGGIIKTFAKAISDVLDVPIVEDYNTGIRDCTFYKSQFMNKKIDGEFVRSSTATGYLNEDVVKQGNEFRSDEYGVGRRKLVIYSKTTVNKILFTRRQGSYIAKGVEYVKDGESQKAFARKGVIVCAGNLSSVILQRSGIGRPSELNKAGIKTLIESPNVGHNFQSHFYVGMGIEVETSRLEAVSSADPDQPFPLGAFKGENGGVRRLQLFSNPHANYVPNPVVFANNWEYDPKKPSNVMSIAIGDLNPTSRGTIMVAHSDPEAYPSLNFNALGDPDDLDFMVEQYIQTYNIIKRARKLDPKGLYKVVYPSEEIFQLQDEKEKRNILSEYVRATYTNFAHFSGQCQMGRNIEEGVVDGFLNVFGTNNLKVADLSISPIIPDGNTSIPAQIIGLNAVRFIQENDSLSLEDDEEFEDDEQYD